MFKLFRGNPNKYKKPKELFSINGDKQESKIVYSDGNAPIHEIPDVELLKSELQEIALIFQNWILDNVQEINSESRFFVTYKDTILLKYDFEDVTKKDVN